MTPYVSKNPREAYMNYRDLDIRINKLARLVRVKTAQLILLISLDMNNAFLLSLRGDI